MCAHWVGQTDDGIYDVKFARHQTLYSHTQCCPHHLPGVHQSTSQSIAEFTKGHQYRRTDGLVGTGLMQYKAHSPKYQHFMLFPVPVYSKYDI